MFHGKQNRIDKRRLARDVYIEYLWCLTMGKTSQDHFYSEGRLVLCYVYLLLCGDEKTVHIKVGVSQEPIKRALALRNTSPLSIDVMATVDLPSREMALNLEQALHHALDEWRTNGEWFSFAVDDKPRFNAITRAILSRYESPSRALSWTKMNLKELASQAHQRRGRARHRWKTSGLAYRDAVMAGLTV